MNIYFKIKKKLDHFTVDVEYAFEKGVLVIQGESGAGKTTLLNCISGLKDPDEGRISLGDQVVFDNALNINIPTRLRNLGYLFQNYALFPHMTVYQNIIYGIKNSPEYKDKKTRVELLSYSEYIMKTLGIHHLKKKLPNNISGGEKQRVALTRAIVTKPKLLLLDEPFSALDQKTKAIVYQEFASFKELFKIPTILITHDKRESEMFGDEHILIQDGVIVDY
ncbi:MAG: ATP-binding cassette domain-containing protein [Dehalobacterium sp.]